MELSGKILGEEGWAGRGWGGWAWGGEAGRLRVEFLEGFLEFPFLLF